MGHHHHEDDNGTYYLDQLCMIALCGAFAGVCITLYFWQTEILTRILAKRFHSFVLWGGIALLVAVVMRAVTLWIAVGKEKAHNHDHEHSHDHEHGHDHEHCHGHDHEHCEGHEHAHAHEHHHDHGHTHEHGTEPHKHVHAHSHEHTATAGAPAHAHAHQGHDHDHPWAPWRYGVLLLPIMLFLLRMPNNAFGKLGKTVEVENAAVDSLDYAQVTGTLSALEGPLVFGWEEMVMEATSGGKAPGLDFKTLEQSAWPENRDAWKGKRVRVTGQFLPSADQRQFNLVRIKINCCAADAVPLKVVIACRDPVTGFAPNDWVEVTGRIDFRQVPGQQHFVTVLQVPSRKQIVKTIPDPDPYIQ
jgi:hypothetical protein